VIWGAGLDVLENEPTLAPGPAELDNVVVVPHIASATAETRHKMGQIAVGNVVLVLGGKPPQTCVSSEVLRGCVQFLDYGLVQRAPRSASRLPGPVRWDP
jgi:glyoxylate reductase